jgi:2-polyprenyl-3-methyl-5-hydroxy-6-metoxy-1,4-benzoquinol methylase
VTESEPDRATRRRQRALFDSVAALYDTARVGYPQELIDLAVSTADLARGARVLEVGCGTGQLTRQLVPYGFALLAIDLGAAMIDRASRHVGSGAEFEVTTFEELVVSPHSFDLIVSATAFHWTDPEVRWSRAADLLRPGGWIALFATREQYDDPLGAALTAAWTARRPPDSTWPDVRVATMAEQIRESRRFDAPIERDHVARRTIPAAEVLAVEQTRATSLSYNAETRASFITELRAALAGQTEVRCTQHTELTLAQSRN